MLPPYSGTDIDKGDQWVVWFFEFGGVMEIGGAQCGVNAQLDAGAEGEPPLDGGGDFWAGGFDAAGGGTEGKATFIFADLELGKTDAQLGV